jgi:hypothetical protein
VWLLPATRRPGDYVCRLTGFSFPAPPVRNNLYLFLHHVAELVGTGSVPVNFVAGAFAADVRHPRITSFGTFTAVVNNQGVALICCWPPSRPI